MIFLKSDVILIDDRFSIPSLLLGVPKLAAQRFILMATGTSVDLDLSCRFTAGFS